jgi:hypothetical protein
MTADTKMQSLTTEIVKVFLNVFRTQCGAPEEASVNFKCLESASSHERATYQLQVYHQQQWLSRRMTIGPIGTDSRSKSDCFHVIFDDHLVIKVPKPPIKDRQTYLRLIRSDRKIVNQLLPKISIVPSLAAIFKRMHTFHNQENLDPEVLEEKYTRWLEKWPNLEKYLMIENTYIFFMDLSQYYFLGYIVEQMHDLRNRIRNDIIENPGILWEPYAFEGRYGDHSTEIGIELRKTYGIYEKQARVLLENYGLQASTHTFSMQRWFALYISGQRIAQEDGKLPQQFIQELNRLLKTVLAKKQDVINEYRRTVKKALQRVTAERNKAQIGGIISNLLDLLSWLKERNVAIRDLKPDNLLVVGDSKKYPQYLENPDDYTLGFIDVETAVDIRQQKETPVKQPLLGGSPIYATPTHFFLNKQIEALLGDVHRTLHLQDWHACIGLSYRIVTGEHLFEQTAKILQGAKKVIGQARARKDGDSRTIKRVSSVFWESAVNEFDQKLSSRKTIFERVPVRISKRSRKMLQAEIAGLKRKTDAMFRRPMALFPSIEGDAAETYDELAKAKYLRPIMLRSLNLLSSPSVELTAYDIMYQGFHLVLFSMYDSVWRQAGLDDPASKEKTEHNYETTL